MVVDTHVHLDDERFIDDLDEVLNRARDGGVERFIIPGADPINLKRAVLIAQNNSDVYFAVGVHPYDMDSFNEDDFKELIMHKKCVAVGECGLDYFRLEGTEDEKEEEKRKQKEIFIAQIELAKKYKKPLIVHIRDASRDSKEILLKHNASEVGGVLHCYNADEELLSLAKEGFYFGIGGVLTFSNAKKLIHVLPKIPLDKLLIETDAPYLTPTPHRGKRNEPLYTQLILKKIAELLEISEQKVEEISTKNAFKLFHIS
ncbi:TatD-related deoxyribonuclease [Sulfurimonas denitrificans DSM 1251]|uniref:TatD-related deoxyribonuclease n=1 Tax=Sulfurimonas denitrificans (strain ATCC 33889 / DSM 1251) TaxID=326298 RepID=Q30RM0_SULDN|nr:TatD family hydrolase [Sulfurimonas denitrificans]ABB44361.1 TatD-related deoxyribonuclease [Sulfurimonas denitrificans DSM 1251]MDD3441944.1 TatD family hydrolase [Sulfurimonas denitrificans]